MNAKEYHIKIHSVSRFIIAFIITQSAIFSLLPDYIENQFLSILFGQAKIKSVFTKEAFLHIWKRRFLFSWEKDLIIPWKIVDSYVIEEDRTWDSFIINLSTETRYKISRLNILSIKDDFDKLVKDFPRLSNEFKENGSDTSLNLITEGKSKYESKSFRQSLYILLTVLLILCIIKIINSDSLISLWSLGVIGSAIAYYWLMMKRK